MASNHIRRQIEDIHGQGAKRLQELSIIVLLLMVPVFFEQWFGRAIELHAHESGNVSWALYFTLILLIVSLVFLICSVAYFWRLRNKPQFHVLFIEREAGQKQIQTKRFFTSLLIPAGVSIGLEFAVLSYVLLSSGTWWSLVNALWSSLERTPLSLYPLMVTESTDIFRDFLNSGETSFHPLTVGYILYPLTVVVCSGIVLYSRHRIEPERVQKSTHWLLFIPLVLSIFYELFMIVGGILEWFKVLPWFGGLVGEVPSHGSRWFIIDVSMFSYRALFVASLIILLYLTYHIQVEHRNASTLAKEEHLRCFIEKGVAILPTRILEGHSHSLPLDLTLSKDFMTRNSRADCPYKSSDYLEAEIQTIGLKADHEKTLKFCEASSLPTTTWIFSFKQSGVHALNLTISVIRPPDQSRDVIFMHQHTVKVDSFLSISWVPVLALIMPVLVTVVQFLLKIGH